MRLVRGPHLQAILLIICHHFTKLRLAKTTDISIECRSDSECDDMRCYQGKCICPKERPIEDRGSCLPLSVISETCSISEQCLGNSVCIDSICSCANNTISLFNPSAKISYCHPKRYLGEECSHDAQCPDNSFCSTNRCLCQNGYGQGRVRNTDGAESDNCLPKKCTTSSDCESEYHICDENRCLCLADHFDPHTAGCYKFVPGGKLSGNQTNDETVKSSSNNGFDWGKGFTSILNDLMKSSDNLWYVIVLVTILTILFLALIVALIRKYFLGYCWTAHKKEYEPNNEKAPRSDHFNKDPINNQSFRQKKNETDDEYGDDNDDTAAADRSNLVTTVNKTRGTLLNNGNQRRPSSTNKMQSASETRDVKVDMDPIVEDRRQQSFNDQDDSTDAHDRPYQHQLGNRPLPTSNSTAV